MKNGYYFPGTYVVPLRLCAAAVVASLPSSAIAQSPPDGWGSYQFVMTVDQVQAVPQSSWDQLKEDQDGWGGADGYTLKSLAPVMLNGRAAELTVYIDASQHLNEFGFKRLLPRDGCEGAFQRNLREWEQANGNFLPSMVNSNHKAVRNLPGGKSKYVAITQTSKPGQEFLAQRNQGGRYFQVSARQDKSGCSIEIWFKNDQ